MPKFRNRREAGRILARLLGVYANRPDALVLALPRGGVPVGYEVALALNAPLDAFTVRKIGVPGQEELALGAVATGGVQVLNQDVVAALNLSPAAITALTSRARQELEQRERSYRDDLPPPQLEGRTVVLVDDGLATGATMRAAAEAVRRQGAARVVVAVPVAAPSTCEDMRQVADDVICAMRPEPFYAVGLWYGDFSQTTDDEVRELLARAPQPQRRQAA